MINANTFGAGNAGDITIDAGSLSLTNGAEILAQTSGQGDAGDITVNASESVTLSGIAPFPTLEDGRPGGFSSGLLSPTTEGATGQGGVITITTPSLNILDGAVLSARSQSDFPGGNIIVNANTLEIGSGGQILSTAFSEGNAGNITINVSERISIAGSDPTFSDRFAQLVDLFGEEQALVTIDPVSPQSGIFANTQPGSTGDSGSISIGVFQQEGDDLIPAPNQFTEEITIADGAIIAADSQGEGNGGIIFIRAEDLTLDNQAQILAETTFEQDDSTARSEINLEVDGILRLENDSTISTQAFSNADGGNINIDAGLIIALPSEVPNEGNDIVANAGAIGGNITITTEAIFGLEVREATPNNGTNDIDASSALDPQFNGIIEINITNVDLNPDIIELPDNIVKPETITSQACPARSGAIQANTLTITGRDGLPPKPTEPLTSDAIHIEGENVTSEAEKEEEEQTKSFRLADVVPARGMIIKENGDVILTAYPTPNTTGRTPTNLGNCI